MTDAEAEGRLMFDPESGALLHHPESGALLYARHRRHLMLRSRNLPGNALLHWHSDHSPDDLGTERNLTNAPEDEFILPPYEDEPLGLRFKNIESINLWTQEIVSGLAAFGWYRIEHEERPRHPDYVRGPTWAHSNAPIPIDHSKTVEWIMDYGFRRTAVRSKFAMASAGTLEGAHNAAKSAMRSSVFDGSTNMPGETVWYKEGWEDDPEYFVELYGSIHRFDVPERLQGRKVTALESLVNSSGLGGFWVYGSGGEPYPVRARFWSSDDNVSGGLATVGDLESVSPALVVEPVDDQVLVSVDPSLELNAYLWMGLYVDDWQLAPDVWPRTYCLGWGSSSGDATRFSFDLEPEEEDE